MNKNKVLCTLFALNKEDFSIKLKKLDFLDDIHIDFMDGKFTDKKSVNFEDMVSIKDYPKINFQIHLMAYEPEQYAGKIKKLGFKKVFLHWEAFETSTDLEYSIEIFREKGIEIGLVINPGTEIGEIMPYISEFSCLMVMSVWPGKEGQTFISNSLDRIKEIRKKSKIEIYVDGGIKDENIKDIIDAGANTLCVGSYVSSSNNVKENYLSLIKLIK